VQLVVGELWRPASRWHEPLGRLRAEIIDAIEAVLSAGDTRDAEPAVRTVAVGLLATCLTVGLDWQVYAPSRPRTEIESQIGLLFQA